MTETDKSSYKTEIYVGFKMITHVCLSYGIFTWYILLDTDLLRSF